MSERQIAGGHEIAEKENKQLGNFWAEEGSGKGNRQEGWGANVIEVEEHQNLKMDVGNEGKRGVQGFQISRFDSPFSSLAVQEAKQIAEEGDDLCFN